MPEIVTCVRWLMVQSILRTAGAMRQEDLRRKAQEIVPSVYGRPESGAERAERAQMILVAVVRKVRWWREGRDRSSNH
jgi:hypothetical protein